MLSGPAFAGTITTFDLPGYTAICGNGIADDGTVVGGSVNSDPFVSFLYQNGKATIIPVPFSSGLTSLTGINDGHRLVGSNSVVNNSVLTSTGFTLLDGKLSHVGIAGAESVAAVGINNSDVVVGSYRTSATGATFGFIKDHAKITTLNNGSGDTGATAIDPQGTVVVGNSVENDLVSAWVYQAGTFTTLSPPHATETFAGGINHAGLVTGTYFTGSGATTAAHGFFYKAGKYKAYDVPHATSTEFVGVNAHGDVTGCYSDSAGLTHGLIYTP